MSKISDQVEKVYAVYDLERNLRVSDFYVGIGPAKSFITRRHKYSVHYHGLKVSDHRYVIGVFEIKPVDESFYFYDKNKKFYKMSDMTEALFI